MPGAGFEPTYCLRRADLKSAAFIHFANLAIMFGRPFNVILPRTHVISRARTYDLPVNSRILYQLSYDDLIILIVPRGFEPLSMGSKPIVIDLYTMELRVV